MPAEAGIQKDRPFDWIPAFAGMTIVRENTSAYLLPLAGGEEGCYSESVAGRPSGFAQAGGGSNPVMGDVHFLAIDTPGDVGSVAVGTRNGTVAEISTSVRATHSATLLPAVDRVVGLAGISPADLGGVVVGAGPGSFTGIRIAAATAKGISAALEVPFLAYSSLLCAAATAGGGMGMVCAVFDARGRDVFAALYDFGTEIHTVIAPTATTIDDVIEQLSGLGEVRAVGDGVLRHREEIERRTSARIVPPHLGAARAGALVWLATTWPDAGLVEDVGEWEPSYLRASGAERIAAARAGGGA